MAFSIFWLLWILISGPCASATVASRWPQRMTPPPWPTNRRLAELPIFGSLMMVGQPLLGTPIGILAGVYLAEYGQKGLALGSTTFHQRHPAVGAEHRDRPVHLRATVVVRMKNFSGFADFGTGVDRDPGVDSATENMLQPDSNALLDAWLTGHAEVARDHR
jgi:phosphate transport system permease protein